MNQLTSELARICDQHRITEKWILAPSLRTGRQWLEQIARQGQPVVNSRVMTVRKLAVELAAPILAERGLSLASTAASLQLVDHILQQLWDSGQLVYFHHYRNSHAVAEMIHRAIQALRMAGIDLTDVSTGHFESPDKGHDLTRIAAGYVQKLRSEQLVDIVDVIEMAARRVAEDPATLPAECRICVPEDLELTHIERILLDRLPSTILEPIVGDAPADEESDPAAETNVARLRWLLSLDSAPPPIVDGSVRFTSAMGEINEVRSTLRHCLARQVRLDEVELLHTDPGAYIELILEALSASADSESANVEDLPVTFAEGVPCRYSRPGRALMAWQDWAQGDCPQVGLVKMLREGLLRIPKGENAPSAGRLAALLSELRIGQGRDRYLPKIAEELSCMEDRLEQTAATEEDDVSQHVLRRHRLRNRISDLQTLQQMVDQLLEITPQPGQDGGVLIASAQQFLESHAHSANKLDGFALERLLQEIREIARWLQRDEHLTSLDVWHWLSDLPRSSRIMGSGPRPGCLHVDNIYSGGHSGRPHTFIVGLDDSRFPGTGLQDAILLDMERERLSANLPLAKQQMERSLLEFARLVARLRGDVTFSYCVRDLSEDREMFPSSAMLAAFRVATGNPNADQSMLLESVQPIAGFAPPGADCCWDAREWWLWRLCGECSVENAGDLVESQFPWLRDGRFAAAERRSDRFTEFDGHVPDAGDDLDPGGSNERVVSASGLEMAGRCPLAFFFNYGLDVSPPDDYVPDRELWLTPLDFGSMMHRVFEQFMSGLMQRGELPDYDAHHEELFAILDAQLQAFSNQIPPPSTVAYRRRVNEARDTAHTFLVEEARWCQQQGSRPQYLEASLGLTSEGSGTPLDTDEPITVVLPGGYSIRTRGRIDRIDEIGSGSIRTFAIWDYKTGSTWGYDANDPFSQGRRLQPYLYATIVANRLEQLEPGRTSIRTFGFFFPSRRGAGQRISWSREQLEDGGHLIGQLCATIRSGSYLATNEPGDCHFCDYTAICGQLDEVAQASQRKLENAHNETLVPLRQLRCINAN